MRITSLLILAGVIAVAADHGPPVSTPATFTPTDAYQRQTMRGWTVLINPALNAQPQLRADTLELLDHQLYRITRVMPSAALERLQEIDIWVELEMPKTACMCYHVSREWLLPNGYNPDKEGAIEIGNAAAFLDWTRQQPWMVLHELAHGYHDQVFGFDDPAVIEAWQHQVDHGDYDQVLHISGSPRRHYGLTNQMEYFAEATEAYFGRNDFYPFVRPELVQMDPRAAALMNSMWIDHHRVDESRR